MDVPAYRLYILWPAQMEKVPKFIRQGYTRLDSAAVTVEWHVSFVRRMLLTLSGRYYDFTNQVRYKAQYRRHTHTQKKHRHTQIYASHFRGARDNQTPKFKIQSPTLLLFTACLLMHVFHHVTHRSLQACVCYVRERGCLRIPHVRVYVYVCVAGRSQWPSTSPRQSYSQAQPSLYKDAVQVGVTHHRAHLEEE